MNALTSIGMLWIVWLVCLICSFLSAYLWCGLYLAFAAGAVWAAITSIALIAVNTPAPGQA